MRKFNIKKIIIFRSFLCMFVEFVAGKNRGRGDASHEDNGDTSNGDTRGNFSGVFV